MSTAGTIHASHAESTGSLVLASGSPRRRELLQAAGFRFEVEAADIDDADLSWTGVPASHVAPALASFKARRVRHRRMARGAPDAWILAADTVCERDGEVLGKPATEQEARDMIGSLAGRGHGVITGWCLVSPAGAMRLGRDLAWIEIGEIPAADFDRFLEAGDWRGKAGGYNLPEVVARGWPVRCVGDPQTVVGLPIARLSPLLERLLGGGDA